jgi:hypothetical protein
MNEIRNDHEEQLRKVMVSFESYHKQEHDALLKENKN